MMHLPMTSLATVLALLVYFVLGMQVGKARGTYGVAAPAMTGHIEFDKRNRVHMNTLEQMVLFLPLMWLSTPVLGDCYAAIAGLVWSIGRVVYARGYYAEASKRGTGFMIGLLATVVVLGATIYCIVTTLITPAAAM